MAERTAYARRTAYFLRLIATHDVPFAKIRERVCELEEYGVGLRVVFSDAEIEMAARLSPEQDELDAMLETRGNEEAADFKQLRAYATVVEKELTVERSRAQAMSVFIARLVEPNGAHGHRSIGDAIGEAASRGVTTRQLASAIEALQKETK